MKYRIASLLNHAVFKNSIWMLIGFSGKLGFQFFSFVLVARHLGPTQFGAFSSGLSLVTLLAPFVDLGAFNLIIRDVANGEKTNSAIGNSLFISIFTFPIGLFLLFILKLIFIPNVSTFLILNLAIAEFIGNRLSQIAFGAHFANSKLWRNTIFEISSGMIRLILVTFLVKLDGTLNTWGTLYCTQTLICGFTALFFAIKTWGKPQYNLNAVKKRLVPGLHFASGVAAQTAGNDLDKAMLARMASFDSAGIYSAAYRFILVSYLPLNAFLSAVYPKFFQLGINGFEKAKSLSIKILPITVLYGIAVMLFFIFGAHFLNQLLGSNYAEAENVIKVLSFVPLIQSMFFPFADALAGGGKQLYRTQVLTVGLIFNVVFNLIYIPKWGWKGAAYGTIFSQVLVLSLILLYSFKGRISRLKQP